MERLESISSDPERRDDINAWKELIEDDQLKNSEIKEMLLYRTFYFFAEKINDKHYEVNTPVVPLEALRMYADYFGWVNEEVSLTRQFGTKYVDLVFSHVYGDISDTPGEIDDKDFMPAKNVYVFPVIRLVLATVIFIYLASLYFQNSSTETNTDSIPYYSCRILFSEKGDKDDFSDCKSIAESNDDKAEMLFGLANIYSRNFETDPDAAIHWLTRAAEQLNPRAMYLLGALYGEDIEIDDEIIKSADFESARYWLEKAARAGETHAYTHLASLYVLRDRKYEDLRKSREGLILAANMEQPDAYLGMALFELSGYVSEIDYGLARRWLDLYATTSVPDGSNEAAWLLATSDNASFRDARQASDYIQLLLQDPEHPDLFMYLDTVAAVHAANGNFEDAVSFQKQAINLLQKQDDRIYEDNIEDYRRRLSAFQENKAWTEPLPGDFIQKRFASIKNRIFSRELTDIVLKTQ